MATTDLTTIANGLVAFLPVPVGGADLDLATAVCVCQQVSSAAIVASGNTTSVNATFCSPASERSVSSSFSLSMEGIQDWGRTDGETSLSELLFEADGGQMMAVLMPDANGLVQAVTEVSVAAGDFLGPAGDTLTWSGDMPCSGYPDISDGAGAILKRGASGTATAQWTVTGILPCDNITP